ncbi:Probable pre-mRNA-splicing factor ATP-dependent RNA helicase [Babesia bigemina]|uniref:RNA helicase n=1 Tax=Babesia bigemina TaxID=5866 RepID=A0A061D4A8_BABBI|nr:Probable pre-mRNA-splicing factor ATP-dependent RNA helicase [Babesia bigemina]CDR95413.1 Probable pre-mRNA-splicing factor ATP-dependent RNA helicase [Babesia bigemina]|eukprot:XP_012767599.1 Probable pre-mRNA-splicing factor ATP-dependent RNA helicase [Babesia bigemina]
MVLDGLSELQSLSASSKVAQILKNHLDLDNSDLVEFIIHLAKKAKSAADFNRLLDENEAEMPTALGEQLFNVVRTLDPPKKNKETWDDIIAAENDERLNFPALSMRNSDIKNDSRHKIEVKKEGELSDWAKELLKQETGQAYEDDRERDSRRNRDVQRDRERDGRIRGENVRVKDDRGSRNDYKEGYRRDSYRSRADDRDRRYRSHERRSRSSSGERTPTIDIKGQVFLGRVNRIMEYGAFVSFRTKTGRHVGLLHVSEILPGKRRLLDVREVLKENMEVYVKVVAVNGDKVNLSMKTVDQHTGKEDSSRTTSSISEDTQIRRVHTTMMGESTNAPLNSYAHGVEGRKRRMVTDLEKWEQQQLINSGVLTKGERMGMNLNADRDAIEEEEEVEIEINEACPTFLKGQTRRSGIELSPIKIVSNPEGSLARAITTSSTIARERRDAERAQEDRHIIEARRDDATAEGLNLRQGGSSTAQFMMELQKANSMHKREHAPGDRGQQKQTTLVSIKDQRESLPIFSFREDLLQAVRENDVLVVVGETGSGKSTQIPQYLAESGYNCGQNGSVRVIGCTQPRRVAAISVAKRVAEEVGCRLGQEVGYCIRFEDCTTKDTMIKFMTDGMLLREVLQDPMLERYSCIMLDEAHERTIATDVLFALLKECCANRNDFKLIVTSATLEAEKFSAYFNDSSIFSIPGRMFPVEILHTKEQESDYVEASLITVLNIHLNEPAGDILLFLTGQEEIDVACRTLHERMKRLESMSPPPLIILPVYAALPGEMQSAIFEPTPPGCRKCVIATNIAEASLTIDGIFYVIDPGFAKVKRYNPRTGMESLVVVPISQASAKQRSGRAGRTGPGKCYRLYTEDSYRSEMLPTAIPEIQRTNLANVVILLKAMGINDFLNFDFMDKPPVETLIDALDNLYHLGALDDEGLLTRLGRKMAEFPMDPNMAKMLLTSIDMGCSDEIITIVSMLSIQNIFYRPQDKQAQADRAKSRFTQAEGDHLTLLEVYNQWRRNKFSSLWCHENFLQSRALLRAQEVRKQLISIMDRYNFKVTSCGNDPEKVAKSVCAGFFHHSARRDPQEGYRTILDQQNVFIHPSSALYNRSPEYVVYHELVMTTKEYMRDLTTVKAQWLLELAPSMFKKCEGVSKAKMGQKIEPLHNKFEEKDAWRLSKRRG